MTARLLVFSLVATVFSLFVAADPLRDAPIEAASPSGSPTTIWGDLDCLNGLAAADALVVMADQAEVDAEQETFCPIVGSPVSAGGSAEMPWGDLTCDGAVTLLDVLLLLTAVSGGDVNTGLCPPVGSVIGIQTLAEHFEIGDEWDDFGDAPNGTATGYSTGAATGAFPVADGSGAPYHPLPFVAWLGEFESVEETPRGVDTDDDGLVFLELAECETSSALVTLNTAGLAAEQRDEPLYLNAWADWNSDGAWSGQDSCAAEEAVVNLPLDVSDSLDIVVVAVEFTGGAQVDEFWLRLTLTTAPVNGAVPEEIDGETEDYLVVDGEPTDGPLPLSQPAGIAQPQDGKDAAGHQFLCRGDTVSHEGGTITFDVEQTTESYTGDFRVKQIGASLSQPTDEKGKKVPGNMLAGVVSNITAIDGGRVRLRLTVTVTPTTDAPTRLQGPLKVDVGLEGREQKPGATPDEKKNGKKFSGSITCAFSVAHLAEAFQTDPERDGYFGGPGRAGKPGEATPEYIFALHDKSITIKSDTVLDDDSQAGSRNDPASLKVFGPDGALVPKANWKTALGIKDVIPAGTGRGLKIIPAKDTRTDLTVRVTIFLTGTLPDGTTKFSDYYRITFVHETGAKARKLIDDYTKSGIAFNYEFSDENDAQFVGYVADDNQLVYHTPSHAGFLLSFEPETVCTGGDDKIHHTAAGLPGTSFSMDHSTNVNSDLYYIAEVPDDHGPTVNCGDIADNLTGFGPGSPYYVTNGGRCGTGFVFTEYNGQTDTFRQGLVSDQGAASGLGPIPGGSDIFGATCYETPGEVYRLAGSRQGTGGRAHGVILPCKGCPGDDVSTQSDPAPTMIIEATEDNTQILNPVVSPDTTKIVWALATLNEAGTAYVDSEIWVGDFNFQALTVTNRVQLTSDGQNFTPAWSPGGSEIAFLTNRDGNLEIYIMDADGENETNLTNTPTVQEGALSWQAP